MKKVIYFSIGLALCAQTSLAQEGISRQVQALKTAMESFRSSTNDQLSDMTGDITELESSMTSFETCAAKRMIFIDDTTLGDADGCAAPMNGGGFNIIELSDLTNTGEDVRMHRGRVYVESPSTYSDDCVGKKVPNVANYHTFKGVFTHTQATERACEESMTSSSSFTSVLAKFGSDWMKIAQHGSCDGSDTREFVIISSKDKTSSFVTNRMTTVNNTTIRTGHNLTMENSSHINAPWTGDFAVCGQDRYNSISSMSLMMAE